MSDLIDRRSAIEEFAKKLNVDDNRVYKNGTHREYAIGFDGIKQVLESLPIAQAELYGYKIEHLALIARVLQKENLPPERITEALTDIGRIVAIVTNEFEETLRKAVEQCMI